MSYFLENFLIFREFQKKSVLFVLGMENSKQYKGICLLWKFLLKTIGMHKANAMYIEEKLDLVLTKIEETQQLLELFVPDLRKRRHVAAFLGITEQSLKNWLKDSNSPIEQGVHYYLNSHSDAEFIPSSIIALKRSGGYKNRREIKNEDRTDEVIAAKNITTQKILKKIGKISSREETPKGDVL